VLPIEVLVKAVVNSGNVLEEQRSTPLSVWAGQLE
jgi:hypothetical protein